MKKQVEISIMGQKIIVRSDSNEEYVREIAHYVEKKVKEVMESSRSVASLNVAILAAMNIADDYMKYKQQKEVQWQDAERKIQHVLELIEVQT